MNTDYTFINEKFSITEDVYFTVDTTVIKGNKICKLKTLKIFYHGDSFEMNSGETVHKYFIQYGIRSIPSIELINYLNNLINHENLYNVYSDEFDSNLSACPWARRENKQDLSSFIIHDKSNEYNSNRYKKGLISESHFIKSELDKLRNLNYPLCYSNYDEIKNIPVFCYMHPSLAINQGSTIILCHIGYILEKLANYKKFPEFNTQAIISFTNIVNESSRTNKTVEIKNQANFEIEVEKLQNMYMKKKEKCKSLKNEIAELKRIMLDVNSKNDYLINQNNNLLSEVSDLKVDNQNLNNKNDKLLSEVSGLKGDNLEIKHSLSIVTENVIQMSKDMLINQTCSKKTIKKELPKNYISTKSTEEVFILINKPSLTADISNDYEGLSINDVVLDSISCQLRDRNQNLVKHEFDEDEDEIIFESRHGNSLDFNKFVQEHRNLIRPLNDIVKTNNKYIRKFVVKIFDLEELKEELKKLIIISNGPREELLEINNKSIEQVVNPLKNISNAISNIYSPDEEAKTNLDLLIQKINDKLDRYQEENRINNEKINQNIENLNQKVEENIQETKIVKRNTELILDQQITKQIFKQIFGENEEIEIFKNHKYRTINAGVEFMKYPTQESKGRAIKESYLTVNDLLNSRFRSSDGSSIDINQDKINQIKKLLDS